MTDRKNYSTQRNFCKKLLRTTKIEYFNNLDKKVTNNRTFCRTFVPLFSNKNSKSDKIILEEDVKTVSHEEELCRIFRTYFASIPVLNTFQNHLRFVNIKQREFNTIFSFNNTNENEVHEVTKNLNIRKTCQSKT